MQTESKTQARMADSLHRFNASVSPLENKRAQRDEIENQIEQFLAGGGAINRCAIRSDAPSTQAEHVVVISNIEYPALTIVQAAKHINRTRDFIHKQIKLGMGPIFQKQMGGKRQLLFPLPQFDKWARQMGLL